MDTQFNLNDVWDKCKKIIKSDKKIEASFELVTDDTKLAKVEQESGNAILTTATEFNKILIESSFYQQIQDVLNEKLNSNFKLLVLTEDEYQKYLGIEETEERRIQVDRFLAQKDNLNPNYSFENFIVSLDNKKLYSAALSVSMVWGKWNPLFIFGASGLGKTHLLHAIGNQTKQKDINKKIRYIEAGEFSKIVHKAKGAKNVYEEFHNILVEFEKYDMLLVDDIQFIASQPKTKEIFFNIFNLFVASNKQVVITSDKYPEEIKDFEDRFITRFKSGLIMGITPPDVNTTIKIMKHKLTLQKFNSKLIPLESYEYIATNFSNSIRELEGAINMLIFENIQYGERPLTLDVVKEIFKDIVRGNDGLSFKKIVSQVASYFKLKYDEIIGKSRLAEIMKARHVAIFLCKSILNPSLKEIGLFFGKDHSTIISSIRKIEKEREKNPSVNQLLFEIRKTIV